MLSIQSANDSWQDNAYLSALVVRALAAANGADISALAQLVQTLTVWSVFPPLEADSQ